MASPPSRLSDKKYINWLKSTLYLLYLKGGVEGIVDNEAKRFHEDLQKALGVYGSAPQCCFVCTPTCIKQDNKQHKWRMSCPLCDLWLNQIMLNHLKKPLPKLSRENTNPQLWPTSEFEVCKLYMPYGCQQNQSAKDADIQSILKLFENCLHFTNCGRIGRMDLVNKLLKIRNTRVHSGDFKVDDADLQVDMQTTLDFLQGLTNLSASERQAVQEALDQITKLHAGILDLSLNKELELHALQMKQNALETEVNHLDNTLVEHGERIRTLEEDVKTIQTSTVKCSEIDAKASATDLQMLAARTESIEQRIQKLHEANVLFKKFLQENNLEEDITRLSASIQQHGQIIQEHGRELETHQQLLITQQTELQTQKTLTGDMHSKLLAHEKKHALHDKELHHQQKRHKSQDVTKSNLEEAILSKEEDQILTLLQTNTIPNRACVRRVYDLYRRNVIQKSTFDKLLANVYTYIKTISNKITFVTACFDEQIPDDIVFIVVATERLQLDTPYNTKFRLQDEYNDEAAFVTCHEKCRNKSLTSQESKYTADILQKQADNIMKKHSNVQMISACSVKSRYFGTDQHTIEEATCIVIYVSVKGFIPVHEKILPKTLQIHEKQFPVDVREGGMILFAAAKDYHSDIKMGCLITGENTYGTVGAFIDKGGKTYCLTCAHIFTDNCNLLDKIQKNGMYKHNGDYKQGYEVNAYQNVAKDPKFKFGEVSLAFAIKGDGMLPGVDLAVVEISDDQRKPLEGYFPDDDVSSLGYGPDVPMIFRSGMCYGDKEILSQQVKKTSEVFKHGCETAFTKGSLLLEEVYARQTEYQGVFGNLPVSLDAQLVVGSIIDGKTLKPFACKGDSGAFVFAKHGGDQADLRAIGMVVAGTSFGTVFVTPIWAILHYLGQNGFCGLKRFEEQMDCSN